MKQTREYEIAWQGLKPGLHTYVFDIDDRFMEDREANTGYKDWDAKVTLTFDKHESYFILNFDIDGKVTVPCDRCGDEFTLSLWDEFKLVIKLMGDDANEIEDEDDVVFISRAETVIDISNWIYEFLLLSIPLQKIHPDLADGKPGCNPGALDLLHTLTEHSVEEAGTANDIWKGLEAFKIKETKKKSIIAKKK